MKIFSGIRPSGKLHLGNYLGAIKNWLALSEAEGVDQAIYAVVDYHGITTPFDPKIYQKQIMETAIDFLAAGINPDKSLLIRQSKIPEHTELAWIFSTITPVGWLLRLPTYREKLGIERKIIDQEVLKEVTQKQSGKSKNIKKFLEGKLKESIYLGQMGLLGYPVLMAADILIYKSNLVPVGEDQMPHIDVTNEIARKFNSMFGETFEPVKAHLTEGARIMSIQDPKKKMSKTGDETIGLIDSPDEISAKIKKAVTDSGTEIKFDPESKAAVSNLMTIYHLLSGKSLDEIQNDYSGKSYVDFKNDLAEVIIEFLKPFQQKYKELSENIDEVEKILTNSETKAKELAQKTLSEVKQKIGLI